MHLDAFSKYRMGPEPPASNHHRRARWIAAGLIVGVLAVTACSGSNGDAAGQATTTTAVALPPLEQPSSRCVAAATTTKATLVRFQAADGTSLNGVLVGRGQAGVVLVHQYPSDLCGFWPFADYLAKKGLAAFAIDLRCFGRSACPEGDARGRVVDDIAAAVAELRRRGMTRVGLVGASMGGSAVLIAGTRVQPPVTAVVSLSGEADPTSLVGGIPLNAGAVVAQLRMPTMLVVATNDRYASVDETRAMYRAVKSGDKRLEMLSDNFDGVHGWDLLNDPAEPTRFSSVAAKVAAFLTAHSRG
jgi:alpha-beta hydrolase superfamily lysophospholipase